MPVKVQPRGAEALFAEEVPPFSSEDEALFEAERCLLCGGKEAPAPCVAACPARVDVPLFIKQILERDHEASGRTIFAANVLGGTCARVCPVDELCEGACVLHEEGRRPVAIGRLQRFATDWVLERGLEYLERGRPNKRSVGVIGAGPAGLACAAELAKLGYRVTVYERDPDLGGLVTRAIAPYKQHIEPLPQEAERIARLGVEFRLGQAVGESPTFEELERRHQALFLGIGMGKDVEVRWEGDDLEGVYESLPFIEELKLGDPRRLRIGERVAVIGGGNTALDVAREAVRLGAKDVMILYRRTEEQMPAFKKEVKWARKEGVHFYWLVAPKRLRGTSRVEGIECLYMRLGAPDASGRPRPEPVPGTEFVLPVDTVVKAIGQQPRTEVLKLIPGLELDGGLVKVDPETLQTSNPRYFAGGDCINGGATVVQAVRDGKLAAAGIDHYLSSGRG
ncbi:MAG: NAD(P)-dependent oxidoreductase [Candidatus Acetothermia bacterium]|jgi:glutamate synthase (NADPH/NADH) small chain|nr:NAD(P)-dependent oxidoreductase [Candidatus Acetothermia bacterium]MDH7505978.1 NAD(P)-dependent oxidoreductase [Candidatus Acetothermia bacterium]